MRLLGAFGSYCALAGLLITTVVAQQMPACAGGCMQQSLGAQSKCQPTDNQCICSDQALMGKIETCVLSSCTVKEGLATKNITATMCNLPVHDITHVTPIVSGISGGLATIAVTIRTVLAIGDFYIDDLFIIVALVVGALPMGILEFFTSADGFGRDMWTVEPDKLYRIIQFAWLGEVFYFSALTFSKASFLFFCLRIFPRKETRRVLVGLIVVHFALGIACTVATLLNCVPISVTWTGWDGEPGHKGRCINFNHFAWSHAVINIVLDFAVIGAPIPELMRLSLSRKKKTYIIAMFTVGLFTTIISILRLQSLVNFSKSSNYTYDNVPAHYWSVLEGFAGIFCVCMPALRRFLAIILPSCFGTTQQNSKYEPYNDRNTPNKLSNGRASLPKNSKTSWAGRGITKTLETTVETNAIREDDEVQLVEFGRSKIGPWNATAGSDKSNDRRNIGRTQQQAYMR